MRSEAFAAFFCVAAAVVSVRYFEHRKETPAPTLAAAEAAGPQLASALPPSYRPGWGEEVRIPVGTHNQFFVTAAVNNRPQSFLVDTGASYVALRESDAAAAGIYASHADYSHPVRTANGETMAAFVEIDRIEIEGIRIEAVNAFILKDEQLGMNLLGMSFLSRLESVEARGKELVLRG